MQRQQSDSPDPSEILQKTPQPVNVRRGVEDVETHADEAVPGPGGKARLGQAGGHSRATR